MAYDSATDRIYLVAAEFGPAPTQLPKILGPVHPSCPAVLPSWSWAGSTVSW